MLLLEGLQQSKCSYLDKIVVYTNLRQPLSYGTHRVPCRKFLVVVRKELLKQSSLKPSPNMKHNGNVGDRQCL